MANNYGGKIVTDGLVLALDASAPRSYGGSGTVWADLSGNGNDALLKNETMGTVSSSLKTMAYETNDSASISHAQSPHTNLTYELVFKAHTLPGAGSYMSIWEKSSNWNYPSGSGMQFLYGTFYFSFGETHGSSCGYLESNFSTGVYYHAVGVCEGASGYPTHLYINGVLVDSGTSGTPSDAVSLKVGVGTGGSIKGDIPLFRVYNRPLTANEVLQNYNATKGRFD